MLTPPADLPESVLVAALERSWGVAVAALRYRAVGWGSHHWEVVDAAGSRWFVTADELDGKRLSDTEPLAAGFTRLHAALAAARDLRDCGRTFVVAPVPSCDAEPVVRVGDRFGVAIYPFVDGQSLEWGEFPTPEHRHGVLELLIAVHTAPEAARRRALDDNFSVPHRDNLEAALDRSDAGECGPYARPVARLLRQNTTQIRRLLLRYDHLVAQARSRPDRTVLTHGEPHPGNTMLAADGWLLIDWDTALLAPPERDLWSLDPGNGSILDAYAAATGTTPRPGLLDLYRLRWDVADIAVEVRRFRRPHAGSADDAKAWDLLRSLVAGIAGD